VFLTLGDEAAAEIEKTTIRSRHYADIMPQGKMSSRPREHDVGPIVTF